MAVSISGTALTASASYGLAINWGTSKQAAGLEVRCCLQSRAGRGAPESAMPWTAWIIPSFLAAPRCSSTLAGWMPTRARRADSRLEAFHRLNDPASLYLVAAGGTTFGHHPGGLPLFPLGGPSHLAAYGLNQFLTNQYVFFRGGYLHRVGHMPAFIGSGLFFDAHYEIAKIYDLPTALTLPNDGVVGLIMQTIFGPVLMGGSIGDSGHPRWFFQLGRVF